MTDESEPQRLVRVLAFALRHQPLQFGVGLDDEGFADLDELVVGIRFSHYDWATLDQEQIEAAVRGTDPGRFELRDGQIRARYGHSARLGLPGKRGIPPEILFHGTSSSAIATVLMNGLQSMSRAFVHLTSKPDYAAQVMTSKGGGVVLCVRARRACEAGIEFFQANEHVWLVRKLAADFLAPVHTVAVEDDSKDYPILGIR